MTLDEDSTKQDPAPQEQENIPELEDFITEAIDALGAVEEVTAVYYSRPTQKENIGGEQLMVMCTPFSGHFRTP